MKKHSDTVKKVTQICCAALGALILAGCFGTYETEKKPGIITRIFPEKRIAELEQTAAQTAEAGKVKVEADWSEYFDGLPGAAVIYDTSVQRYTIYNSALSETRRSPCSTFKIISSLIALEDGLIEPDNSTRKWSGEIFWKDTWNGDIDFREAFRESCVWYFREVIDEIGPERMQEELLRLAYGNCDITDWEGRLNTNNRNRALTGFWIESSLAISPREQTEVMERIFGKESIYSAAAQNALKEVMRAEEPDETGISIYGKTGMGKAEGVLVDAWFTGFAERGEEAVYFCVYLGQTDRQDASSTLAKEIAIRLVRDYWFCN